MNKTVTAQRKHFFPETIMNSEPFLLSLWRDKKAVTRAMLILKKHSDIKSKSQARVLSFFLCFLTCRCLFWMFMYTGDAPFHVKITSHSHLQAAQYNHSHWHWAPNPQTITKCGLCLHKPARFRVNEGGHEKLVKFPFDHGVHTGLYSETNSFRLFELSNVV